ncbi:MAG: amidohydrolase family protein [Phycisphaerales bacterium]
MLTIANARVFRSGAPGAEGEPLRADGCSAGLMDVRLEGGRITAVVGAGRGGGGATIDARGRVLVAGFVDGHTHACYHDPDGSHRLNEWDQKRAGATYLEILGQGGGIMASVRRAREATVEELAEQLLARLGVMLRHGTTTVEVKSGYGLTPSDEIKMLRAIAMAARGFEGTVRATALLGHAIDPDVPRERFIASMTGEALDRVHAEFGTEVTIDAFCEKGAWTLDECGRLFERAMALGHPVRVHADQFTSMGMVAWAIERGVLSIDHLEATTEGDHARIAASAVYPVGLPVCGLHVDGRYANLRGHQRACIASNHNPGSAPCLSMPLVIALAVRGCGIDAAAALRGATLNPARMLGFVDRGYVGVGARADVVLLRHRDARGLAFSMGENPCDVVVCGGKVVTGSAEQRGS